MEAEDEDDYPDIDPTLNPMSEFDDNIMHMEEIFPTGQLPYELLESSIHLSERTCEQNKYSCCCHYFVIGSGRSQSLLFNDNSGLRNIGFQIPISLHDNDNSNDDSGTPGIHRQSTLQSPYTAGRLI